MPSDSLGGESGQEHGDWNPGPETEAGIPEGLLMTGFSWLSQLAVYTIQDHLPGHVTIHSVQAPSTSIISQGNTLPTCQQACLMEAFSLLRTLLPRRL